MMITEDILKPCLRAGRIPCECDVQIELIDLLIDNGAIPGNGNAALAHGNVEAAKRIIEGRKK